MRSLRTLIGVLGWPYFFYAAEHGVVSAVLHMEARRTITGYANIVRAEYRKRLASYLSVRFFAVCQGWNPRRRRCAALRKFNYCNGKHEIHAFVDIDVKLEHLGSLPHRTTRQI